MGLLFRGTILLATILFAMPIRAQEEEGHGASGFMPHIWITGEILGSYTSSGTGAEDGIRIRKVETGADLGIGANGNFTTIIGIENDDGEWEVELEEAYLALGGLPLSVTVKAGQFLAAFGETNRYHRHFLPWVDRPLASSVFFGEEGLKSAGLSANSLLYERWTSYLEITYEISRNELDFFGAGTGGGKLSHLLNLRNFYEISNSNSIIWGLSGVTGYDGRRQAYVTGMDINWRHRPVSNSWYRELELQAEILSAQTSGDDSIWGMYSSVQARTGNRWIASARYDFTEYPGPSGGDESQYSAYLTYSRSIDMYWRLGYLYSVPSMGENSRGLFMQLTLTTCAHAGHAH